ncbi:GNAT family N-acetyltransferase [Streptomyces laurentii]|uniref:GNAT family N-acetyltransferase n=1 Tax=Streptomyces laurentii TaxID=39478 RepID=UPI00369C7D25
MTHDSMAATVLAPRPAMPDDAAEISRLRSAFVLTEPLDEKWLDVCRDQLTKRLGPGGDARAYVIDAPAGGLVACALGLIQPVLPAPRYPKGLAARIHAVATEPAHRRRGYARAVVSALLDGLTREGVTLFDLHATEEAAPLYGQLGFTGSSALMRMTRLSEQPAAHAPVDDAAWLPPEEYAATVPKCTAFACVYFTDEDDRPLQLRSVYSPSHPWQLVGGVMDPGERPWETAVRECREETGLVLTIPPKLLATVHSLPGGGWPYSTIGLIFDGGQLTTDQIHSITLAPREHDEARVLPVEEWRALMPPRDFRRLNAMAQARRTGEAAYVGAGD